ncbi:adhesion G-protein coupled receptor G4 [Centroberyx affinis]|uniref:adhesion G-protein coupled receptor G4 n=1 Tax=Centroberyx affinis TaxID=166261 RepID=UPI003A5BDD81
MVILEMSGPVDVCSLANFLQRHIDNSSGITNDEPLTRMVVCGPPGLPANDLLASNLTWVASNLLHSEICQPDHKLKCDGNETFAVLLTDSCQDPPEPLPTNPSTLQPSPLSNNNTTTVSETTPPSPASTTQQNNTTAENNAATKPKNASEGTVAQPNATAQLNSTQTSTAPPVLQASTQNVSTTATPLLTTLYFNTTATTQNTTHYNVTFNATLPTISPRTNNTVNTTLFPTFWLNTTLPNITAEAYTTAVPLNTTNSARTNTTQHNTTAIQPSTTQLNTTDTLNSNWESNSTHPNTTAWPVYTEQPNATQHSTTLAADSGAVYNTTTTSATTPQKTTSRSDNTTSFVSTVSPSVPTTDNTTDFTGKTTLRPNVTVSDSTTAHNTTASGIPTLSTPTHSAALHNTTNNTTPFTTINPVNLTLFNTTTPSLPPADNRTSQNTTVTPSDSTLNTTTLTPNYTTVYNETTATNNGTLQNRTVTASNATINTTTTSPSYTTAGNITTAANNRTLLNITTPPANTTLNTTTLSLNNTTAGNITTAANNQTLLNITTPPPNTTLHITTLSLNNTTAGNVTTAANNRTLLNITTPPPNTTLNATTLSLNNMSDNITTAANNRTLLNITTPPANTTLNATTLSLNNTTADNVTAAKNRTLLNITTPPPNTTLNTTTLSLNNTSDNVTIAASNRTLLNITTPPPNTTLHITTLSLNNTTPDNVTTATTGQRKQNTTVTATPGNETQYNATTSPDNSTLGNATSTVGNTTVNITTVAPRDIRGNNQTTNYTTVSVPYHVTTPTTRNDTNSTTATPANSVTPVSSNTTTETDLLYSAATNVNPDFNQTTKGPGFNLTTAVPANTSLEPTAAASTMTATARHTTTTPGPLPGQTSQTNSTTTEVFLPAGETAPFQTDTPTTKTTTITTTVAQETTKNSQEEEEEAAAELLDQTQDASQLNASQVEQVVGRLEKLLEGPTVSQSVGQTAINVISNLMEGDALALTASANRLIRAVDDLGFKLVVADETEVLTSNSLLLAVRTVDGTNFPAASINIFNTADLQLNVLGRSRSRSRSRSSQTSLGSVFLPSSLTEGLSPEEQRQASRVQFTFYTTTSLFQDTALDNQTIVSPVLGSSVANLSISNLRENIQFTIQNINPLPANYVASCAFWDFSLNGGGGGWNSAGCFLLNTTQENTSCSCNHLTSFAILLDVSRGEGTDPQHTLILNFITYIGCGISAIFLAVTLFTYICFQKLLRDIPSKILVQLCLSLFLLNLLFLLDGWLALYPSTGLCISTAFFLHYFLLTSFTWAGLEALHMYLSIVRVFTPYLSRYMLKFSLLGWGLPLIVVIVVISVDKNNYGLVTYGKNTNGTSDDFCWLRNDIAFYVGVVAYFILIFALTLLVFIVVLVQLARIKRQNPQNQSPQRGLMTDLRSIAGLVILLGLTWGFALFAWGPLYLPFIYLFSIFNSLQGFFIFVFHCAVKENVRRQWRTYLCCGRLRLAENSEWSRTATQNPKKLSVTTATSSALNPASRSSSVISEGTNSSGSVFGDSGISDGGSNVDVVLNEIHRRNAAQQDTAWQQ